MCEIEKVNIIKGSVLILEDMTLAQSTKNTRLYVPIRNKRSAVMICEGT